MIDVKLIENCEKQLEKQFKRYEEIALFNQEKVLNAFKKNRLALRHFAGTSGYGYGDEGRDTLNAVVADIFATESAICSPNIVSGTHALSLCLYGVLRPNDKVLCITGEPYDTLRDIVYGENNGSLKDFNITFTAIPLKDNAIDKEKIEEYFKKNGFPKMVYMQRSRGYEWRNAFRIFEIEQTVEYIKSLGFLTKKAKLKTSIRFIKTITL